MRFALIDAEKAHYPVAMLCGLMSVSRAGYYAWHRRPESQHSKDISYDISQGGPLGMEILFYQSSSGASPVEKYLDGLAAEEAATIADALQAIGAHGLAGVDAKPIEGKLWELRFTRQRIFYVLIRGPRMVLLHAYKKQGQKAPRRELETAKRRMAEVLSFGG